MAQKSNPVKLWLLYVWDEWFERSVIKLALVAMFPLGVICLCLGLLYGHPFDYILFGIFALLILYLVLCYCF